VSSELFDRHRETLEKALQTIHERTYWSPYPEIPSGKIYGETAKDDGKAAHKARLNKPFEIDQPGTVGTVGAEVSPYGPTLGITYPKADLDVLLPAAQKAMEAWGRAEPTARLGVCLEALARLNKRSFEMANAVMHTTGQGFMMSFQAGGPHAQDHGLEALAYAWEEMQRYPGHATWQKQVSKTDTVTLEKHYRIRPHGVAVTVGCSTFPTWNSYPGIFASLATGNAVVIKPHPLTVLPHAITVEVLREVLAENGFDPNVVTLAADSIDAPITKELVTRPEVKIVDYTGSSEFGNWIEENARQAVTFTEKAGVNTAIIDSVEDLKAVTMNLAFTFSLYSGQMCTTTQNVFIPKTGINAGGEQISFEDAAEAIASGVNKFLSDPGTAAEVLGCVQNENTAQRVDQAKDEARKAGCEILRDGTPIENEKFPEARTRSPLIIKCDAAQEKQYMREVFGPIVYVIGTDSADHSIELASRCTKQNGAITNAIYSTDDEVLRRAVDTMTDAGATVSCNLTGHIYVNQKSAFSDVHVSGVNPAGNATLVNGAYVSPRFHVVESRAMAPQPAEKKAKAHAGV